MKFLNENKYAMSLLFGKAIMYFSIENCHFVINQGNLRIHKLILQVI